MSDGQRCRDWVAEIGEALGLPPDTDPRVSDVELFVTVRERARQLRAAVGVPTVGTPTKIAVDFNSLDTLGRVRALQGRSDGPVGYGDVVIAFEDGDTWAYMRVDATDGARHALVHAAAGWWSGPSR